MHTDRTLDDEYTYAQRFGRALRAERHRAALSQEELAFAADVHPTYVSRVERAESQPTVRIIVRLADALGIAPSELFARADANEDDGDGDGDGPDDERQTPPGGPLTVGQPAVTVVVMVGISSRS